MQEYFHGDSVSFSGIGVHFGANVKMEIIPQSSGGIVFERMDLNPTIQIPALYSNVESTNSNTTIAKNGAKVGTIEHLMAALYACNIRHAHIFIDGAEVPLMEGGSNDFIFGIECLGITNKTSSRLVLNKEITVEYKDSYIKARPAEHLEITCIIDFPVQFIGKQSTIFDETKHSFKEYISHAKTFSHIDFVHKMQAMGIAKGGDVYSAIIFDNEKVISPNFSYNKDDFAKHKILDFVGDISICEYDIKGQFECYKTSHQLNNILISKIFEDKKNYQVIT